MNKLIVPAVFFLLLGWFTLFAEEKKVALLFLTRSDLNHPLLWKAWINPEKFTVYNHAKHPVEDPWFAQYRIPRTCETSWAYVIYALQALLQASLRDSRNYKFVFLTESCVPLHSSDHVYAVLTGNDKSYMCWKEVWWKKKDSRSLSEFPPRYRKGNDAWFILNRKHAEMIAKDHYWIRYADLHPIANESYPSTFFCMEGVLDEINNISMTFADWNRSEGSSPYTFTSPNPEDLAMLRQAKKKGYLFARKLAPEFPLEELLKLQGG